jgi:hypothetical protein
MTCLKLERAKLKSRLPETVGTLNLLQPYQIFTLDAQLSRPTC